MQGLTEAQEQTLLFQWAAYESASVPELKLLHHIPNGGSRAKAEAANLKRQGVKKGVPDICLPVPRSGFHGLYVEMKRQKGGTISEDQREWIKALNNNGYLAVVCKGFEEAKRCISTYLEEKTND